MSLGLKLRSSAGLSAGTFIPEATHRAYAPFLEYMVANICTYNNLMAELMGKYFLWPLEFLCLGHCYNFLSKWQSCTWSRVTLISFHLMKGLLHTWAKLRVSELVFCSIRSSSPVQGGLTLKAKEWTPGPKLINITSILTNGRPASQTVWPLGHKVGVCPGALRTLSGRAQVPSIFLCTALAPTSHVSLLSRLGRSSWASQRRFILQD